MIPDGQGGMRVWRRDQWPNDWGTGGPGVQDADGNTIGRTAGFVYTARPVQTDADERTVHSVQGDIINNVGRIQIRTDYYRNGLAGYAAAADEDSWANGPPASAFTPAPDPGNGNGNGNGDHPPPPEGGGEQAPPPP